MATKVKELPKIMSLPSKAPKMRDDELPHWKIWKWAVNHPNVPWRKND